MTGASEPGRDPKETVRSGWDHASLAYRAEDSEADAFGHTASEYAAWLAPLLEQLPAGGRVLDLGCGIGVPADRILARRFRVTGVDISPVQIERARRIVREAEFLNADMTEVDFPSGQFVGALALYSLIHVPLDDQPPVLEHVHRWLAPGGLFLLITGHTAFTGYEEGWLGSPGGMFWSHADADTYQRWLSSAGFELRHRRFVPEPGSAGHELFLVQKGTGARRT